MLRMDERGSISIETAIEMAIFAALVFTFMTLMQYVYTWTVVSEATAKAAEKLSCYSTVLCNVGLSDLSDTVKSKALSAINDSGEDDGYTVIAAITGDAMDLAGSEMWKAGMYKLVENEIKEESALFGKKLFDIQLETLEGSDFFVNGNDFSIYATAKSNYAFPGFLPKGRGIRVKVSAKGNAWLYGAYADYDISEINVWELSNFKRGRVLEKVYNSNLPDNFPVVDIYEKKIKTVTMIVSIDSSAPANSGKKIAKPLREYIRELSRFNGENYAGVNISSDDVAIKKLLIVFPDNIQTPEQSKAVMDTLGEAAIYGVTTEIVTYQHSFVYE